MDKCSGSPVKDVGRVTSSRSLGWTNTLEALEGLDGDQSNDGFVDVRSSGGITILWVEVDDLLKPWMSFN